MKTFEPRGRALALTAVLALCAPAPGRAGELPTGPIVAADGHVTIAGDVAATISCAHSDLPNAPLCSGDTGFFNYTDYEHSALRLFRVDVTAAVKATDRFSLLAELRTENADTPQPYGLYVRIKPWTTHDFDIQAGRIPTVFGAFSRRTYPSDNILIGYPLAYQYLTSLRADALPASADDLLRMRGRGWLASYPIGNPLADRGVPLVSAFRWDTGAQVHAANRFMEGAVSVTVGTLSNPLVSDDNGGRQISGRAAVHPTAGLVIGFSGARGPFVTQAAADAAGVGTTSGQFTQTAWGADIEYSHAYYLVRAEALVSDWRVPVVNAPFVTNPLRAASGYIEGRYKFGPRFYVAGRLDRLGFSEVTGTGRTQSWDAPVTRTEVGGGFALQRNLDLKMSLQHDSRSGGRVTAASMLATQLVFWF